MHHPTDKIVHTTTFVTPVMEHWLKREIAHGSTMRNRSNNLLHHEQMLYHRATSHFSGGDGGGGGGHYFLNQYIPNNKLQISL